MSDGYRIFESNYDFWEEQEMAEAENVNRHTITLNDIQCLVVLDALHMLIANPDKHKDDKRTAQDIRDIITEIVNKDKKKEAET